MCMTSSCILCTGVGYVHDDIIVYTLYIVGYVHDIIVLYAQSGKPVMMTKLHRLVLGELQAMTRCLPISQLF